MDQVGGAGAQRPSKGAATSGPAGATATGLPLAENWKSGLNVKSPGFSCWPQNEIS